MWGKENQPSAKLLGYCSRSQALFGFLMVPETFLGSPRVHPSHSPTLAERRSPSRSASTTSSHFKDALEHLLEDAAWGLPHAAVSTNHEQPANQEPCTPPFHAAHIRRSMQSARQEHSRFPMTRTPPRFTPATSAQRTIELGQDVT